MRASAWPCASRSGACYQGHVESKLSATSATLSTVEERVAADRWPESIDVSNLARYARAFANGVLELARQTV